ncbi:uncharacterized protein [Symphalangus syndactylus]|uniref:uncharacterized protein n=1 Tax=Symphalangus syndactylus TaxID=9590 RepID=UPI003006607A
MAPLLANVCVKLTYCGPFVHNYSKENSDPKGPPIGTEISEKKKLELVGHPKSCASTAERKFVLTLRNGTFFLNAKGGVRAELHASVNTYCHQAGIISPRRRKSGRTFSLRPNFCSLDPEQSTEGPEQDKGEGKSDRSSSREPTGQPVGVPRKSICNWEGGGLPKSCPGSHNTSRKTFPPHSFPRPSPRASPPHPTFHRLFGEAGAPCLMGGVGVLIMGVGNSALSFLPAARVYFVHGFFCSGRYWEE